MFSEKRVIQHYAMVLFEFSEKNHNRDSIPQKIRRISLLLSKNLELNKVFDTCLLSDENKIQIVEKIFYSFDIFIFHFIKLLITKKRGILLRKILLEYQEIYNRKSFLRCILTSAYPLSIDLQKIVVQKIISSKSKKYKIFNKIDKSIIGGFLLRTGYKEWDLSIKGQLFNIQKKLKNSI
ncbi:MAG: ATP synthase F1 subunit delta [Flavobacteriales bacterium]|jgi:F-type H+-transporting ATPase subunit delta|uniref:ATP synthase F1 subunit delta n=1 Tax=Blattabacterium sp. (Mastotermes darwiniensis) TaxID=39768 RepID=UPI000231DE19|nr:ATP synthase F1 subunit delta [Blattabacterium sp. (Mastotermes darwiniensis)]AER40589.1 ATP synthase F1, delta subunit [Blattabacterium sp. (Mastotermes darwiniensis) str. MADAR]MDR1805086.1 ATP synthase F1 subunit delta [Flavobacteriales bacterium]